MGDDGQWRSLCKVMGQPALASDPRFASLLGRRENHDALDEIIAAWTSGRDRYDAMHALQAVGIPSGPVLTGRDIHYDPHFKSRNFLERVQYPPDRGMGERMFLSRPYKFSKSPLHIQGPSPAFGQHNEQALRQLLGVSEETYRQLVEDVVITTVPTTGEPSPVTPQAEALERGVHSVVEPGLSGAAGPGGVAARAGSAVTTASSSESFSLAALPSSPFACALRRRTNSPRAEIAIPSLTPENGEA